MLFEFADRPYTKTGMVSENWVLIFIIWGSVLTLLIVLLAIWLTCESKRGEITTSTDSYETMTGSSVASYGGEIMMATPRGGEHYSTYRSMPYSAAVNGRTPYPMLEYTNNTK